MEKIRIITESAADFTAPIPPNLTVIPMTVRFGDETFLDGVTISHQEFYEKLIESDQIPSTSLISPGEFEDVFGKAVAQGETVIAITVCSKLSGTYQSAVLAAQEYPGKVFVVDSFSAAVGEQILVRYALELVESGLPAERIVEALETEKEKIRVIALLDTLEYLKKGGRISSAVAFVGGMLAIKPVIAIADGEISMLGTARGSKNGNNFLMSEVQRSNGIDFTKPFCLAYTGLSDRLLQKYIQDSQVLWKGYADLLPVSTIGATIGTHAGPNAIAVAFFSNEKQ